MRVWPVVATTALTFALVTACAAPLLAPDARQHVCQVAVDGKFGSPVFHANPLATSAGGLVGAARGAVSGFAFLLYPYAWIVTVPLGAVIGAAEGTACAVASQSHPTAEADFERILKTADTGSLTRALEAGLNAPRAGCVPAQASAVGAPAPDTIIEIDKVDVTMGCAFGKQGYGLTVQWRALAAANHKVLVETTTGCAQKSSRDVALWFADPGEARLEIERVLARIGQRMAGDLLSPKGSSACNLRSGETGEVEAQ